MTRRTFRLGALGLALCFALALLCASAWPQAAHATYADVTDSYPASQDVTVSGNAIPASKIPDGTYSITGSTSSYMCIISNCTLTVKDGAMSVTFTMSKAYTRLYLGTAEEAAAHTNADGTDDSAYYKGTPPDGYVAHVYTLPIAQLNHKITLATYAGATKTRKWFTRTVVFNSSAEVDQAVASGKSPSKKEDNGNGKSDDDNGGSKAKKTSNGKKASGSPSKAGGSKASTTTGSGAASGSSSGSSGSGSSSGSESTPASASDSDGDDEGEGSSAQSSQAKSGPRVVEITPVAAASEVDGDVVAADDDGQDEADEGQGAYHAALAAVGIGVIVLAAVLVLALRRLSRSRHEL